MMVKGVVSRQGFAIEGVHGGGVAAVEDDTMLGEIVREFWAGMVAVGGKLMVGQVTEWAVDKQTRSYEEIVGGEVCGRERPTHFVDGDELRYAPKRP